MYAIAAMSRNRVVGKGNTIPWRIPDEFRWFRRKTLGGVVVMGRRTFESLPKPLEGRLNVVLTRDPERLLADERWKERFGAQLVDAAPRPELAPPGAPQVSPAEVRVAGSLEALERAGLAERAWLCGGVELYRQFLGRCSELYLSVVSRDVEGDAYFPAFEHLFELRGIVAEFPDFHVLHYVRNQVPDLHATDVVPA